MNREMNDDERRFAQTAKQALRQSERALDAPTAARLRAARAEAVARAGRRPVAWGWMMPAGALAAAVLVFTLLPSGSGPAPMTLPGDGMPRAEALEVMLDDVDPDLVRDLELYEWLEFDGNSA